MDDVEIPENAEEIWHGDKDEEGKHGEYNVSGGGYGDDVGSVDVGVGDGLAGIEIKRLDAPSYRVQRVEGVEADAPPIQKGRSHFRKHQSDGKGDGGSGGVGVGCHNIRSVGGTARIGKVTIWKTLQA